MTGPPFITRSPAPAAGPGGAMAKGLIRNVHRQDNRPRLAVQVPPPWRSLGEVLIAVLARLKPTAEDVP